MQREIKISQVLECLDKGMSRDEIAVHFEISKIDCKQLFSHPKLKGLKMKKQPMFSLVDDTEEEQEVIDLRKNHVEEAVASIFDVKEEEQN